ncbi:hypothetical protein WA026_017017 [Henosepilachna vigintioctopunctata]|uniref:Uncharacterized protein n=1 Tax=Henosepilachna vigintioctopunctata TaxID=420089 RepID=A0AAW1TLC4_9CUCU
MEEEVLKIKKDLTQNGKRLIEQTIEECRQDRTTVEENTTKQMITIPYVKRISEKIRQIAEHFKIRTASKSGITIRSILTKTRPETQGDLSTSRGTMKINFTPEEQKHLNETSSKHHNIRWDEARIVHREKYWSKRKFKEIVFIHQKKDIFSNPSVEVSNTWRPILTCMSHVSNNRGHQEPTRYVKALSISKDQWPLI